MNATFWFFDLDGTLADTDRDIRLSWKAALKALGLESPDFDEKFVTGPPIGDVIKMLFPGRYTPEFVADAFKAFAQAYDTCGFPNTREYPGVLERVRALRAAGDRVFVVTNKRYAGTLAIARKFGWGEVFEGLYAGDMYAADPAVGVLRKNALLKRVMAEKGVDPARAVMVGDTRLDFEAARENGVMSVAVTWGYGREDELALADVRISSPDELNDDFLQKGTTK